MVKPGQKLSAKYPAPVKSVYISGTMKNQTFKGLSLLPGNENAMLASKLHACHHGLLVEDVAGGVARFGFRMKANHESVTHLEKMELPEGMNGIVKISAGKFA